MRRIKINQIHKMLQEIATGYRNRVNRIIKWYEYRFTPPVIQQPEPIPQPEPEPQPEPAPEPEYTATPNPDEEVDLATTGLSEDDQALVADIMARFKEAKSLNVDSIVASATEEMNAANTADTSDMSQDELIAAICAPKQHQVDDMVSRANAE
jgi:outer membrane biosynthesis protein TonB